MFCCFFVVVVFFSFSFFFLHCRLQALRRELKVKELHTLDAARRRFLEQQQVARETELKRMDDNIKKKVLHREQETKAVLQDIETRTIELEKQKALLEIELQRCQQEVRARYPLIVAAVTALVAAVLDVSASACRG